MELVRNLRAIQRLKREFNVYPFVLVVWAEPTLHHLYLFKYLQKEGYIDYFVGRYKLPEPHVGGTTYPESHNIRVGLTWAKERWPTNSYVIVQAADVCPKPGLYKQIDGAMQGASACVCSWVNTLTSEPIYCTNLFAVSMDEKYWPPISPPDNHDVLEVQWSRQLPKESVVRLPLLFSHEHADLFLPAYIEEQKDKEHARWGLGWLALLKKWVGWQ